MIGSRKSESSYERILGAVQGAGRDGSGIAPQNVTLSPLPRKAWLPLAWAECLG
jgi:hypothetical protein